jgi:hypothetical protein
MNLSLGFGMDRYRVQNGTNLNHFSDEYKAYYDALTVKPSNALAIATDAFVMREVAAGRWAKLDHLVSRDIAGNAVDALISLVNPAKSESRSAENIEYIPFKGFSPDAVDDYINSNYNPATAGNKMQRNSIVEFCYFRSPLSAYGCGGYTGGNGALGLTGKYTGTNKAGGLVGNINPVYPDNSGIIKGYLFGVRSTSTAASLYTNKIKYDATSSSQVLPNINMYTAGGWNSNGTLANKSKSVISMVGYGSHFTQAEIEAFQDSYDALLAVVNTERLKKGVRVADDTSKMLIEIPTYVVENNEVVHPSVVDCGAAWNGYRYWLAITPFTNRDALVENPSVFCSNDAETWIVPPGATNPVVPVPGTNYNADPFLFFENNKLYLGWVHQGATKNIYLIESTDGVTWSEKVAIHTILAEYAAIISLIKVGATYYMYNLSAANTIQRRSSNTIYGPYLNPESVIFEPAALWNHFNVNYHNGKYYIAAATGGTSSTGEYIYMGVSSDGLTFVKDNYPLIHQTESWEWRFYMPYIVNINGKWKLYYTAISGTSASDDYWALAVVDLYFND